MKILLATDGSKFSQAALEMVIKEFSKEQSEIRVLHVVNPIGYFGYPEIGAETEIEQGKDLADRTASILRSAGFSVTAEVLVADPRNGIIDSAERWHADLIVLGSHGRSGMERLLLGSVSEAVLHHARSSVQIVRLMK
jgi:nucleotide-binding universal stress UspA family protein